MEYLSLSISQILWLSKVVSKNLILVPKYIIGEDARKKLAGLTRWRGGTVIAYSNDKEIYLDIEDYNHEQWCLGKQVPRDLKYLPTLTHELKHVEFYRKHSWATVQLYYAGKFAWNVFTKFTFNIGDTGDEKTAMRWEKKMQELLLAKYGNGGDK